MTNEELQELCRGQYAVDLLDRLRSNIWFSLFPTEDTVYKVDEGGVGQMLQIMKGRLDNFSESGQDGPTFQLPDFSGKFLKEDDHG